MFYVFLHDLCKSFSCCGDLPKATFPLWCATVTCLKRGVLRLHVPVCPSLFHFLLLADQNTAGIRTVEFVHWTCPLGSPTQVSWKPSLFLIIVLPGSGRWIRSFSGGLSGSHPWLGYVMWVGKESLRFGLGCVDLHREILPRLREVGMVLINNQLPPQLVAIVFIWWTSSQQQRVDFCRHLTLPLLLEGRRDFCTSMCMSAYVFNMLQRYRFIFNENDGSGFSATFFSLSLFVFTWLYISHLAGL